MKRGTYSDGFTFIEIIIVISIIMVLSVIGIGAYSSVRSSIAIDMETDTFINTMHKFRQESGSKSLCVGVRFAAGTATAPKKITAAYQNAIQGCGAFTAEDIPWSGSTEVTEIDVDGRPLPEISAWFEPPAGAMTLSAPGEEAHVTFAAKSGMQKLRILTINPLTGSIEKTTP